MNAGGVNRTNNGINPPKGYWKLKYARTRRESAQLLCPLQMNKLKMFKWEFVFVFLEA